MGNRLSDISHAVGQVAHAAGYGILADHGGHGVGQLLHEDPSVDNDGRPGRGPRLRDGLVLAIEPMFVDGDPAYVHRPDGWAVATRDGSRSAHFEHTVAVLDEGPEPLTVSLGPAPVGMRVAGCRRVGVSLIQHEVIAWPLRSRAMSRSTAAARWIQAREPPRRRS